MRVARLYGVEDVRVDEEPEPVPADDECLIRVTAVGLCGSDLHWFAQGGIGDAVMSRPLVLGHEMAGVVVGGPVAGTRVAIDPAIPCGRCESCREGNHNLCPSVRFAGHSVTDGGLREFIAWPRRLVHPVPESVSDTDAAVLEPLGVAVHAFDLAHARVGSTIVVVGCGPIGLAAVQVARAGGATGIVAVEPLAHRRQAAAVWADAALDPTSPTFPADLAAATGGRGADAVIECAGNDAAVGVAVEAARPGATVVLAGIPDDDRTSFSAGTARRKGLTFRMSRRMKDVYPRAIDLVRSGRVDVRSLVSHTFPLADAGDAFRLAHARLGLKVVVTP